MSSFTIVKTHEHIVTHFPSRKVSHFSKTPLLSLRPQTCGKKQPHYAQALQKRKKTEKLGNCYMSSNHFRQEKEEPKKRPSSFNLQKS